MSIYRPQFLIRPLVLLLTATSLLPAQSTGAATRRADLAQFRTDVLAAEQSFTPAARAEATERLQRLEVSADTLSDLYMELELARIVALADNGHTMAFAGPRAARWNRVPLRLAPFGQAFHVVRSQEAHADLLGAQLLSIDGRPAAELLALARTLAGGPDNWRDRNAAYLLESPEQLHALGGARARDAATYRFLLADGREVERRVTGEPPGADRERSSAGGALVPGALPRQGWRTLLSTSQAPWALQEPGVPFRWREAPELSGLVIELRQTRNAPDLPIRTFLASMTGEIRTRRPQHLVLDMRMNGGGDLNTARDFMRSLPTLVPGRIFVLTSPWTFSAAISSVGYLEQAAPDRVTIVGELVGDRLIFWSEGPVITLTHSGIGILIATERHDYQGGCAGYSDCHGPVVRNPISVPSLAPDIVAPWTIEAYRAGRDPGIEAVVAAVRTGGS
jgi:hypothetical protein